jgi:glycosyltransferase involved in cell wall biosynthesis
MTAASQDLRCSVIIPTYNGFERLKATIRSVLDQTFPAAEIVVVDDGSTDRTPEITELFAGRIRYERTANGGQQRARNHGVSLSTGNWIALLDHDDAWEPEYLAEVNALVRAHPVDMTLCNSRTWQENAAGGAWKDEHRFTQFAPPGYWDRVGANPSDRWTILHRYDYASYFDFHPSQTSMVTIRRDLYQSLGGFDERLRGSGAENFEFEIRALRVARVGLIWRPLVRMVRHNANASLDGSRMTMDLVDCLHFALEHHGLAEDERAIVRQQLRKRLPPAIDGAFALGQYAAVRDYAREYRGELSMKTRVKTTVAALPTPLARFIASALGGWYRAPGWQAAGISRFRA